MSGKYDDIINLPHHVSSTRPHMPISDRAAQFSPFAALTGYGAAIKETARITQKKQCIDEQFREEIISRLQMLLETLSARHEVSITYFVPDKKKEGGEYFTITGCLEKFNEFEQVIIMTGGMKISVPDIIAVKGAVFEEIV